MDKKISILVVNFNSSPFIELSLYALKKLTKHPYQVFVLDNNSQMEDYEKLKQIVTRFEDVHLERSETDLRGSMAHGTGLNSLVKKVNTPYFSILDADATWLRKNWDEILIGQMNDKIKVIGTQASPAKPQDFPLMFAILLETETFQKLNIDFRPQDIQKFQDTGHEMREKYLGAGYVGRMIGEKNTRVYKEGPFRDVICSEFYLDEDYNNIFACHFGRGSILGAQKYKKGWKKYIYKSPVLGAYLLRKKGEAERSRWIGIAKNVIDQQL